MTALERFLAPIVGALVGATAPTQPARVKPPRPPIVAPIPKAKPEVPPAAGAAVSAVREAAVPEAEAKPPAASALPVPEPAPVAAAPPLPRAKPTVVAALPQPPATDPAKAVVAPREPFDEVAARRCLAELTSASVSFEVLRDNENGACGLRQPLKVTASAAADGVRFSPAAVMGCGVTQAVLNWLDGGVQPAAAAILRTRITALQVADSYSCRGRNRKPGAKLSEHAAGNAIDVSAFQIVEDGKPRWVKVRPHPDPNDPEALFLTTIRKAACTYFSTVLGPGEPLHDDHFHLDIGRHGRSGTYRICQ